MYFFDTPGIGGLVVVAALGILIITFFLTLRWISKG